MSQTASHPPKSLRPVQVLVTLGTTLALLLSAGCSDDSPKPSSGPKSSTSPSTGTSDNPTPAPWVSISDKATGVKFMFPEEVKPERKPKTLPGGSKAFTKAYSATAFGVSVNVSIITSDTDLSALDGKTVLDAMVTGLDKVGSKDTHLSKVHSADVRGGSATDGTITFVSKQHQPAYWRMRVVGTEDAHTLVYLQVLLNSDKKQARKIVDNVFDKLVGSFSL